MQNLQTGKLQLMVGYCRRIIRSCYRSDVDVKPKCRYATNGTLYTSHQLYRRAFVMLAISKNAPKFDNPKGQRGYIRYLVVSTVAMVAWLILVVLSQQYIPSVINLVMSYEWYLLIGAAALAGKFYLKKKLNIVGSVM